MNPLELVSKTLHSFNEKELTYQLLDAFGKKAETFQQYNEVAKIFFEINLFNLSFINSIKMLLKLGQICIILKLKFSINSLKFISLFNSFDKVTTFVAS